MPLGEQIGKEQRHVLSLLSLVTISSDRPRKFCLGLALGL
jgi:hypothetical protein